ncbi:MAG TPA: biotin-dependent carboxyltransferase family protein [Burkholderiaceae bacterium]
MNIRVLKPGSFTTIQDAGRWGSQQLGVSASGPMDEVSHRIANLLVGNPPAAATLEVTLLGPVLGFDVDAVVAVVGGTPNVRLDGSPVPAARTLQVTSGEVLTVKDLARGARCYIAVAGGIVVPEVLGSCATHARSRLGGLLGRPLRSGDVLQVGRAAAAAGRPWAARAAHWSVSSYELARLHSPDPIRVLRGRHEARFPAGVRDAFYQERFLITTQSDRMGFRLRAGSAALASHTAAISEGVSFGTVQLPPDGHPIVLMADRQPTGGYPCIANVITADLPRLAQCRPGESISFEQVTLERAYEALRGQEEFLRRLALSLQAA